MKIKPRYVWIFVIAAAVYAYWTIAYPSGTWRYRMTVVVDTPEGEKRGSAVREVRAFSEPTILPGQGGSYAYVSRGEAVVVDLGQRGYLFALMSGYPFTDYASHVVLNAFPTHTATEEGRFTTEAIVYYRSLKTDLKILEEGDYPSLVFFRDIKDPRSIETVLRMIEHPSTGVTKLHYTVGEDRFEELYGLGVKLKEISIEMIQDDVTEKIVSVLPWLQTMKGYMPRPLSSKEKHRPDLGDFKKGK